MLLLKSSKLLSYPGTHSQSVSPRHKIGHIQFSLRSQ
uniref:Uncharacterized protein n=1 Tax=Rhizophora mucronata TaxID=61149 RepID=A0A2P2MZI9_RHIMU